MPEQILEYFVSTGIVGDGTPSYATYIRKPNGSLRRVCSIDLPILPTREEALAYLAFWLHCKACTGPLADRAEYRRQLERVKGEIVALGGMPDPGDTGVPYGGRSGEAA